MTTILWIIALNWGLPIVGFSLYFLFAWLVLRDFVFDGFYGPFLKFRLADKLEPWHARLWRDWGGVGLHVAMVCRDETERTVKHEGTHLCQQLLGLIFWVVYFGHMGWIFAVQPRKHPYLDCVWERQARARAGQQVDIQPVDWPQGQDDRWPWW